MTKPSEIYALVILELFIAIMWVTTGYSLISDLLGRVMGLDFIREKIPTQLPLLRLWFDGPYGVLPASLAFDFWTEKHWVWKLALIIAIIEVIWVIVQIIIPLSFSSYVTRMYWILVCAYPSRILFDLVQTF